MQTNNKSSLHCNSHLHGSIIVLCHEFVITDINTLTSCYNRNV